LRHKAIGANGIRVGDGWGNGIRDLGLRSKALRVEATNNPQSDEQGTNEYYRYLYAFKTEPLVEKTGNSPRLTQAEPAGFEKQAHYVVETR
jgi:hypothetical protein